MGVLLRLAIPFDVLDAAVHECLPGYIPVAGPDTGTIVQFRREPLTPALVVYRITETQPGDLGTVKVRKVGDGVSELDIDGPYRAPMRQPTAEELAPIRTIPDKAERVRARMALHKRIAQEAQEVFEKRMAAHQFIIDAFLDRLRGDVIRPEHIPAEGTKAPEPQHKAGRALTWVKLKRVRQLIEEGKTKTQACRMVGMDIRTYNAYEADLEELEVEEE